MNIILDRKTKETGKKKLRKIQKFHAGRFIRNEKNGYDVSLVSTVSNYVIGTEKYAATIYNRVEALEHLAQDNNLKQMFVTLTLPTAYHQNIVKRNGEKTRNRKFAHSHLDLYDIETKMKATSFSILDIQYYKTTKKRRWTKKIKNISLNSCKYTAAYGYKELIKMFAKVRKDRAWMNIQKENRIYFFTIEPTEQLVPHMHVSIWVPENDVVKVSKVFFRFWPHPQTHIFVKKIPEELTKKSQKGIEKSDKDIVSYAIKYLNNLKNEDGEVSDLAYWYLANNITPFSFSRTLIPQDIYRKIGGIDTLYDATTKYRANAIYAWNNMLDKKLMKVFINDQVCWSYSPCSMHTKFHPIGSSNAGEGEEV